MCTGWAPNPERSMMYTGGDCYRAGWMHAFAFWYNQCPWFKESCNDNVYHDNTQVHVYEAFDPHRIMLAPGYDGTRHGWTEWSFAYMAHYVVMSSKGVQVSRNQPQASSDTSYIKFDNCRTLRNLFRHNDEYLQSERIDNLNPHTILNAFGRQINNVQIQIEGSTYRVLLIPVDVTLSAATIRAALLNCLETGRVKSMEGAPDRSYVQVSNGPGWIELPSIDALLAVLGSRYMMIGS
ncbi:hypothetical protein BGZ95_012068 [Linnemannia exigua]|uniref:Uncharacterized protein n=1 Tax=Linnemannia exigua TaxID=604196 RepID=A0AAD4D9G3_9FUNG|nr:hypothetical protein BGZ95_012068 [Linnemannia exigua]